MTPAALLEIDILGQSYPAQVRHLTKTSRRPFHSGMASKEWHVRASWSLDKLATEMATHYGYADRTALLKSMIRLGAMLGQESPVHKALHLIAEQTPMLQDKTDAEPLRRWKANTPGIFTQLRRAIDDVSRALGGSAVEELLATVTREAIRRSKNVSTDLR